uniref:Uncharacterized protein n=1 Tax=Arundo donax TaxID=35708 RepID=A0A0A9GUI5_ARUDO
MMCPGKQPLIIFMIIYTDYFAYLLVLLHLFPWNATSMP